ncbi:Asp23/Gls24 family envelope stress response protein [Microlunatus sp. Gsoil 973]|nr:Asp23/Gls24 family envelope stress response protein [Microlunatus sp. Gsoil 973]
MSESTTTRPVTGEEQRAVSAAAKAAEPDQKQLDDLHTILGDTTIADTVVQKIAGLAVREVPGVYAMGNVARRAFNNLSQRVPGTGQPSVTGGVAVQKGERETAIDVSIVVEYGARIAEVSQDIRENVIRAVEGGTGLSVVSVDVDVTDVHLPEDDDDSAGGQTSSDEQLR